MVKSVSKLSTTNGKLNETILILRSLFIRSQWISVFCGFCIMIIMTLSVQAPPDTPSFCDPHIHIQEGRTLGLPKLREGLTHWGRVTHICVGNQSIIVSDNGLSPYRRQAIIWTNVEILLIRPLGTNFREILIEILTFSFKKMHFKVSSAKRRPFCPSLNVLTHFLPPKESNANLILKLIFSKTIST